MEIPIGSLGAFVDILPDLAAQHGAFLQAVGHGVLFAEHGGVVITSVTAELPGERRGRFWPFCLGAVGFATLLFLT